MAAAKKRSQKGKDFAKAKVKLGKGKLKAANATDTSFSSKTIALGQQSIARDHAGVPTTKRNLTLEDLQTQLKHYNANTRKDALSGLRELLTSHPYLATSAVGNLVPALARMVGDEETSVRKALQAFFSWYLPMLPKIMLQPYHSILLFFTTSAMSHIYPEIRHDAVRVLNILLEVFPESIALPWGYTSTAGEMSSAEDNLPAKILECYLALLHIRSGIASNGLRTDMSPAMKALILSSLAEFIRISTLPEKSSGREDTPHAQNDIPTWYMASAFPTQRAFETFLARTAGREGKVATQYPVVPQDHGVPIASTSLLDQESFDLLLSISNVYNSLQGSQSRALNAEQLPQSPDQLLQTLLPILIAAFLDSAPTAFSPESLSTPATSTVLEAAQNTVLAVANIAMDLWRSHLSMRMHSASSSQKDSLQEGLEKLVVHMTPYFPFGHSAKATPTDEERVQRLNIAFCELVALLSLDNPKIGTVKPRKPSSGRSKLLSARSATEQYIRQLLSGARSDNVIGTTTVLTAQTYARLLPAIWTLLGDTEASADSTLLDDLLKHFLACPATSAVKRAAFLFLSRLAQVPVLASSSGGTFFSNAHSLASNPFYADFICSMARYLWELGARDELLTRSILSYLRQAILSNTLSANVMEKLASYLAPYFHTEHPKRGVIAGPWSKLQTASTRISALETAWWIAHIISEDGRDTSMPLTKSVDAALAASDDDRLRARWVMLGDAQA